MVITLWSAKGGAGTTVTAAALAHAIGRSRPQAPIRSGPLLVDLAGDLPVCLGLADPGRSGVAEWSRAGSGARPDALTRLITPAGGIDLLPRGDGPLRSGRMWVLAQILAATGRPVVVDAGRPDLDAGCAALASAVEASGGTSLLVTRCCYLSLRRALRSPLCPTGLVVLDEPGRALGAGDVGVALDQPVLGRIDVDPAAARSVDSGLIPRAPRRVLDAMDRLVENIGALA